MAVKPMNILILMDDQHRHDALSCAGHSMARTPNLDALAVEGTRFTQAVANLPICVPCRHSFITGYYAHQLGILSNQHSWFDPVPVPTLGMRLKEVGYATVSIGKMHWKTATTKRGFDFRAVRSVGETPDEPVDIAYEDAMPEAMAQYTADRKDYVRGGECHPGYVGRTSELMGDELPEAWLCDQAVDYLNQHPIDQPFCLMVSLGLPHPANVIPKDYEGMYDIADVSMPDPVPEGFVEDDPHVQSRIEARWADMTEEDIRWSRTRYFTNVTYVDHCLGRVLDALKARGLEENTLVIFFSDHGDLMGERNNAHTKYCMYDSAVRVPLIVRWPGLNQGQVLDTPVELVDLMPTWLEVAGVGVPGTMPGRSLRPLLEGDVPDNWRTASFSEMYTIPRESRAQWILRENRYKLIERVSAHSALYDLETDPNEFHNQIDDPALADVRDRLRTALLHRVMVDSETEAKQFLY